jgi:hypothetical protein
MPQEPRQQPQQEELGIRHNSDKPKISMVLDANEAILGIAQVLMFGEKKYARGNWLKGLPWTEIIDSLQRHVLAFNAGEDMDPESGLPHVDHIATNALFLSQMFKTQKALDGRTSTQQQQPPQHETGESTD